MKSRTLAAWLFLPFAFFALAAGAQTVPVDVEVGVRWTTVEGNEDLYKTQINENDAVLIRSLTFFSSDFDGAGRNIVDHFRVDAVDLGYGPASSLRIDAGRAKAYRLRVGYRSFDVFSALPDFANPLIGQGIVPGQHTWDRERRMIDVDLELLPFGDRITPFVGYGYSTYRGPGTTTYFFSQDEFKLDSDLDESEREFRVGTAFNFGKVYGSVTQGWRSFESSESLRLTSGSFNGNNDLPVLGLDPSALGITRSGKTEGDTPFTNIALAAQPFSRFRLTGSYARFSAEADSFDRESASGSFLSFPIHRFFTGFDERVTSAAKNDSWRGAVRAEYEITPRFDLMAGYRKEDRQLAGTALIDSLFRDTITFGGGEPGDLEQLIQTESTFDRQIDTVEAAAAFRLFPSLTLRLGASQSDYTVDIAEDLEEISVPGNQSGTFERSVDSLEGSATYASSMFNFNASYLREEADRPVVRMDFMDRDRIRARVGFNSPGGKFRAGVSAQNTEQDNETNSVGLDASAREYTFDAELAPWETFVVRGAWSQMKLDSEVTIRRPETFALDVSRHEEDWNALELGFAVMSDPFSFDVSAARMENEGTIPYTSNRYRARGIWNVRKHLGLSAEWARDLYDQKPESWGKFQGDRFGMYVRYRP